MPTSPSHTPKRKRDPRLDFFRGLGMFIIFIAHMPGNVWTLWIPARFGWSDATEIFVFCSGMASAIAFGAVFTQRGWWLGSARIIYRVWQVYWAHIAMFFAIALFVASVDATGLYSKDYTGGLNLYPFFNHTQQNLIGLMTLTYVPNYFDILPMYIVILAMIPLVMALEALDKRLPVLFVILVWIAASLKFLSLPAEPWSDRVWFFNPFAWQLVFFTGFGFIRGWYPAPPVRRWLLGLAALFLLISLPFAYFRIYREFPEIKEIRDIIHPLRTKTDFGILRYLHFLSLAYLAWVAAGPAGRYLLGGGLWGDFVRVVQKVGQQSLAVFLSGMILARVMGFILDQIGRNFTTVPLVNISGFLILIGVAYTVSWYKSTPWKAKQDRPNTASGFPNSAPAE